MRRFTSHTSRFAIITHLWRFSMSRLFLGSVLSAALFCGLASAADKAAECLKQGDPSVPST